MRNLPVREMRASLILGFAAGIMIGIGGAVLLSCDNRYAGALLFSVALLSICMMGLYLYTGKIGFLITSHSKSDVFSVFTGLFGNAAGTAAAAAAVRLARPALVARASDMVAAKLTQPWLQTVFAGILCGVLMYTAVVIYRDKSSSLGILFCVPVFILAGFEHSIADMFYFFLAGPFSARGLCFILLVVFGNTIGGMLLPALRVLAEPEKS